MNRYLKSILQICLFGFLMQNCYHSKNKENVSLAILGSLTLEKNITIVGDSLAQWSEGFYLSKKLPNDFKVTDLSVAGYTIDDWLQRSADLNKQNANLFIVELGTNDAMVYGTNGFEERYKQLLSILTANPTSKIILCKLPKTEMISIQSIIQANNQTIDGLAKANSNFRVANLEFLFESNLSGVPFYPLTDPIHPNELGSNLIGDELTKIILGLNI